jgi:DNA-binding CsgD family transcriptional regulator
MPFEQHSDSSSDKLNLRERAILEYFAEGLGDSEIALRFRVSRSEISVIRRRAAMKLAARIASEHPFHIREVVISQPLESVALLAGRRSP